MKSVVVIPARYGSSRFPGKPLAYIAGVSMIERVYRRCLLTHADEVVIATDDQRIFDHCREFTSSVLMTSPNHLNGTLRCAEALQILETQGKSFEILVNVQGDEPFIDPQLVQSMIRASALSHADVLSVAAPISLEEELLNPNVVKVVMGKSQDHVFPALYFSRSPIPYQRDTQFSPSFYRHIGLYAFKTGKLADLVLLPPSALEQSEHLEQLRWLENGYRIDLVIHTQDSAPAVDSPEDLHTVENFLKKHPELI